MLGCFMNRHNQTWAGVSSPDVHVSERADTAVLAGEVELGTEGASETGTPTPNRGRRRLRASICFKLTLFICLSIMVASGIPELVLWIKAYEQLIEQIELRLTTVSTLRQDQLKDYLQSEADKLKLISTRVLINNYLTNKGAKNKTVAENDLRSAVGVISDFQDAAIYDDDGQLAIATDESVFEGQLQQDYLKSVLPEEPKLDFPIKTPAGWAYNISRGIFQNQMQIGLLMTIVNASKLASLVYDRTGLQGTGELLVGVPDGSSWIHLLLPPMSNPNVTTLPYGSAMTRAINGESGIMRLRDYSGVKVIAAYRPVGFLRWGLLAKLQLQEAYAPIRNIRLVIVITIVILLIVGVLASLGLAKIFTSPIIELNRAAAALGQGDMRTRVRKGALLFQDEISDLKDAFNAMAQQIASHQFILEHKVQERTSALAHANDDLEKQIDERKRIEVELEKAKDVAMAANRSKSEFLANMSHEIRTPLNAIINFTELCLDTEITPEQQEHLDYVRFSAQHLLRLITDILDFSKIEAGKLEMEEIQFSLFEQLEHAVSVLAARALKNGLELCCSFDVDVPDQIMGDPGRLLQIFVNLIGNAIKFTKKGEVVVSVSTKFKSADAVELLFAVKDTGLGIPQSKQSLLFQAFSQVDSSTQRLYGGTGLGLVISSKLAAAMGGQMWVTSDGIEDHGSTFWFTAKFNIPPSCNLVYTSRVDMFKGVHVLVVDDNETSRKILADILKSWGMIAHGAGGIGAAKGALEMAADSGNKYNLVLLDMWLNGSNACELVHILCERPDLLETFRESSENRGSANSQSVESFAEQATKEYHDACENSTSEAKREQWEPLSGSYKPLQGNLKSWSAVKPEIHPHSSQSVLSAIVMLTSVNHTDSTRCKELGVSLHTSKPVKHALLIRLLQSALGIEEKSSLDEGKLSKGPERSNKKLHILVAEDNPVNQRVAMTLLHKWGHTTVLARNGAEAVEHASKAPFDLILMDVQMPVCDGFEATAKIRQLEKALDKSSTPIVAMTAHAMAGDGERCIAAGMDYYISKPLNKIKLQELLQGVATGSIKLHPAHSSTSLSIW